MLGIRFCLNVGTFWRETLITPSIGSEGNPIVFGPYGSGKKPIINGANIIQIWSPVGVRNVYQAAMEMKPKTVFYNGNQLVENDGGEAGVGLNEWDWVSSSSSKLYVNVGEDPDNGTLEVPQRNENIIVGNKFYIKFENLELKYSNNKGIAVYGLSANIEVANCTFTKTTLIGLYVDEYDNGNGYDIHDNNFDLGSEGIYYGFFAADFKVSGVSFYRNTISHAQGGVVFSNEASKNAIYFYENEIHDIGYPQDPSGIPEHADLHGIDIGGSSSGVSNVFVYKNIIYDIQGSGIVIDDSHDVYILFNLLRNTANKRERFEASIQVFSTPYDSHGGNIPQDIQIINNTIYKSAFDGIRLSIGNNFVIKNNIITEVPHEALCIFSDVTAAYGHNLFYGNGTDFARIATQQITDIVNIPPLFTDISRIDGFKLQSLSPCIGAGTKIVIGTDLPPNFTGWSDEVDIGAFKKYSISQPNNFRFSLHPIN